jgi:polyferredoxin
MGSTNTKRQTIRKTVIFVSFLLLPVTLNFLSPYLIVDSASQSVVNGSFVLFAFLFVSSLALGRLWCAWLCPGAGLQEAAFFVNGRPARGGKLNWIKWGIWIPWIGAIAGTAISSGGYTRVDLLYSTESGISTDQPLKFITYYAVIALILMPALLAGRRAFCHYGCWMAPFMIIGRKLRKRARWPALGLRADASRCKGCKTCTSHCPMSLDVHAVVQRGIMENSECILCGTCVDGCSKGAIAYSWQAGR